MAELLRAIRATLAGILWEVTLEDLERFLEEVIQPTLEDFEQNRILYVTRSSRGYLAEYDFRYNHRMRLRFTDMARTFPR